MGSRLWLAAASATLLAGCKALSGDLSDGQAASDLSASIKSGFCSQLYTVGDVKVLDRASMTNPADGTPLAKIEAEVTLSGTPALQHLGLGDDCLGAVSFGSLEVLKPLANSPTTTARVQGYWRKWQSGWRLENWVFEH
jgi:hypothetical protein